MASPLPDQRAQASVEVPRRLFIPKKLTKRTRGIDFAHQGMSKGRALADACSFLRGTRKQAAPPCRPPRRKLALPTLTRKPINWDSREAMESSFSRVFPIPPSCRKAPPRRRSNIAEKSAEKSALAMILGLYRSDNFRKPSLTPPPPTFPPQLGALPNGRERPQMARQKTRRFYISKLGKSTARILRPGVSPITPRRPHAHASEIPGFEAPTARRRTLKQLLPRPDKHPETAHSPQSQL